MHNFSRVARQSPTVRTVFVFNQAEYLGKFTHGRFSRRHERMASSDRGNLRYPAIRLIPVDHELVVVETHAPIVVRKIFDPFAGFFSYFLSQKANKTSHSPPTRHGSRYSACYLLYRGKLRNSFTKAGNSSCAAHGSPGRILPRHPLRAQTHYLALIDNQAEDMYLDLKEKFVVDPDTDSRYAMAFEKQTQSHRALEILSREIDRLPNKIRKTIEMLVWFRNGPAAEPAEIEEQTQIEKDLPKQTRPQHYQAHDEDTSLEEFNRAVIEAVERHGLHISPEAKELIKTEKQSQFQPSSKGSAECAPPFIDNQPPTSRQQWLQQQQWLRASVQPVQAPKPASPSPARSVLSRQSSCQPT